MERLITGVRQVGFVVEDLEEALRRCEETLGFSQWERFELTKEDLERLPHLTHGKPLPVAFKGAKGMVGNLEFEWIQPVEGPSIYQEFLQAHGPGVHHLYVEVEDFEEAGRALRQKGFEAIQTGLTPFGTQIAYFDTYDALGVDLEIGLRGEAREK